MRGAGGGGGWGPSCCGGARGGAWGSGGAGVLTMAGGRAALGAGVRAAVGRRGESLGARGGRSSRLWLLVGGRAGLVSDPSAETRSRGGDCRAGSAVRRAVGAGGATERGPAAGDVSHQP